MNKLTNNEQLEILEKATINHHDLGEVNNFKKTNKTL